MVKSGTKLLCYAAAVRRQSSQYRAIKQVKQNHNKFLSLSWCRRKSFFECWSIKIYPKSHRYLVFAVKSGTKLLCYAAAVRRQFFGKWLHLNMQVGSTGPSGKRWGMKTIAKFPRCVFDILPHKAELLGAAHIDCRITNFVLKSPQPMSKKI